MSASLSWIRLLALLDPAVGHEDAVLGADAKQTHHRPPGAGLRVGHGTDQVDPLLDRELLRDPLVGMMRQDMG
jgi:hypothetical protein